MITQSAKLLWLLRHETCVTNTDAEAYVGAGYRKAVQRLRDLGIVIKNARLPKENQRSIYILDKDNVNIVEVFDGVGYTLANVAECDPIMVTEINDSAARMYQIGRQDRSLWSKIKDWFRTFSST